MTSLIVCTDLNGGIGVNNTIPWHSSEDFKHFKRFTTGKTVVMGYKTWQSLPAKARPLPDRLNVIVTSRPLTDEDRKYAEMLNVIFIAESTLQSFLATNPDCVVMGGAKIYQLALPHVNLIVQSVIQQEHECDAFFQYPENMFFTSSTEELADGVVVHYRDRVLSSKVHW